MSFRIGPGSPGAKGSFAEPLASVRHRRGRLVEPPGFDPRVGKSLDPGPDLVDSDGRQGDGGELAEPANHLDVRVRSRRFRNDVGVQQVANHRRPVLLRAKRFAGTKSRRAGSKSSTPPSCRSFK